MEKSSFLMIKYQKKDNIEQIDKIRKLRKRILDNSEA